MLTVSRSAVDFSGVGGIWDGPSHSGNVYCGQMNLGGPQNISIPPSTGLHNTVIQLQHSLALLEMEIVELSEQVHALTTKDTEQLREQLDQIRNQLKMSIQELKGEMDTLHQDREMLKKDSKELKRIMGKELQK